MTIKGRFERFTRNIRPTNVRIKEANRQTEWMIERLHDKVADDGSFTLKKVLRAGSNAKFTSLLRTDENAFDVDLGAYYSRRRSDEGSLGHPARLHTAILIEIYHQKPEDDFTKMKSAGAHQVQVRHQAVDIPIIIDDSLGIANSRDIRATTAGVLRRSPPTTSSLRRGLPRPKSSWSGTNSIGWFAW